MKKEIVVRLATVDDCKSILFIYGHYVLNTAITFEYEVDVNVYPDPAHDYLNISILGNCNKLGIELFDITGKNVLSKQIQEAKTSCNISNLTPGLYLLKMNINDYSVQYKKIMVAH